MCLPFSAGQHSEIIFLVNLKWKGVRPAKQNKQANKGIFEVSDG